MKASANLGAKAGLRSASIGSNFFHKDSSNFFTPAANGEVSNTSVTTTDEKSVVQALILSPPIWISWEHWGILIWMAISRCLKISTSSLNRTRYLRKRLRRPRHFLSSTSSYMGRIISKDNFIPNILITIRDL